MNVKYLPFASIINKPEKGKKQRDIIPYTSGDQSMTEKSLCSFFNNKMKVTVRSFVFQPWQLGSSTYRWGIRHYHSYLRYRNHSNFLPSFPTGKGIRKSIAMERKLSTLIPYGCIPLPRLYSLCDYPQSDFLYGNEKSQGKYHLFVFRKSWWQV